MQVAGHQTRLVWWEQNAKKVVRPYGHPAPAYRWQPIAGKQALLHTLCTWGTKGEHLDLMVSVETSPSVFKQHRFVDQQLCVNVLVTTK